MNILKMTFLDHSWELKSTYEIIPNNKQPVHTQLVTQQSHCWAYTPRKPELKEARVPQYLLQGNKYFSQNIYPGQKPFGQDMEAT